MNTYVYAFARGGTDEIQDLEDILDSILNVVEDPWSSSLLTLQEFVLRRMTILLDE